MSKLTIVIFVLLLCSCHTAYYVSESVNETNSNDLYLLPIDVTVKDIMVNGKERDNVKMTNETKNKIANQTIELLSNKYKIRNDPREVIFEPLYGLINESYEKFENNSPDKANLPKEIIKMIDPIDQQYFLLISYYARYSVLTDARSDAVSINAIIENKISGIVALIDKNSSKFIYINKESAKTDIHGYEAVRQDVMKLLKPIYYRKTPNCN